MNIVEHFASRLTKIGPGFLAFSFSAALLTVFSGSQAWGAKKCPDILKLMGLDASGHILRPSFKGTRIGFGAKPEMILLPPSVARLVSIDNVLMSGSGDTLVLFPRASIMARGVVYLKLDFDSAGNLRVADQNKTEPSFIAAPQRVEFTGGRFLRQTPVLRVNEQSQGGSAYSKSEYDIAFFDFGFSGGEPEKISLIETLKTEHPQHFKLQKPARVYSLNDSLYYIAFNTAEKGKKIYIEYLVEYFPGSVSRIVAKNSSSEKWLNGSFFNLSNPAKIHSAVLNTGKLTLKVFDAFSGLDVLEVKLAGEGGSVPSLELLKHYAQGSKQMAQDLRDSSEPNFSARVVRGESGFTLKAGQDPQTPAYVVKYFGDGQRISREWRIPGKDFYDIVFLRTDSGILMIYQNGKSQYQAVHLIPELDAPIPVAIPGPPPRYGAWHTNAVGDVLYILDGPDADQRSVRVIPLPTQKPTF